QPLADGGDGTSALLTLADDGETHKARVTDPLFRPVTANYGISFDERTAFIDMAAASGLHRIRPHERNPLQSTSQGTGELIVHALNQKCKRIILGLGGTATVDCGLGIAHALGIRFFKGERTSLLPRAANLSLVSRIDRKHIHPRAEIMEFILLTDVQNPLLGTTGALMYGSQKGLEGEARKQLHDGMTHYAELMQRTYRVDPNEPGMGAAGGAALTLKALFRAKIEKGADFVMRELRIRKHIENCDLILTGEGRLDEQTAQGKVISALTRRAEKAGVPVVAVCGQVHLNAEGIAGLGLRSAHALYKSPPEAHLSTEDHSTRLTEVITEILSQYKS
ncbi:MAG: glycerate kinase, partial [Bacteroidota bacterium]